MSNQLIDYPHVYNKGKILKFKKLDSLNPKTYFFTSDESKPSLASITKHCNNLNQIVARCWLKLAKLNAYFGIQKDPSESQRKHKVSRYQYWSIFETQKENGSRLIIDDQAKEILVNLDKKLEEIKLAINKMVDS